MKKGLIIIFVLFSINIMAQNIYIAHRGASFDAPENTLAASKLAWEQGADAVECDIYLTKDNRIMVIHDKDTKRTCTEKKNLDIKDSPSILLRDLDAGAWKDEKFKGEKIPFLSELIDLVPENKFLVIEIKCGSEIIPALKREIEKSGKQKQLVFIGFGWETILETQKEFPQNKCYWLSSVSAGLGKKMEEAANAGLAGVNLRFSIITEDVVANARKNNLEVLTWTVDDPIEAKRLIALGVTKITTNRPKWLKEQIENQY